MQIRAITFFAEGAGLESAAAGLGRAAAQVREAFASAGLAPQGLRLATTPFPGFLPAGRQVEAAAALEAACVAAGFDYISLGPWRPGDAGDPAALLLRTERCFASAELLDEQGEVDGAAILAAAGAIRRIAAGSEGGFGNLRFAATAGCRPGIPFFPAAYHAGGPAGFALAIETADLAVQAAQAPSPAGIRQALSAAIEAAGARVEQAAAAAEAATGLAYLGADFSLAPFPEPERSTAAAFEQAGAARFGAPGTLYLAAQLTRAVREARVRRAGFSGIMLPVLEDSTLAARSAEGTYSLTTLLACSAVCGTGLDTIPLPGDTSEAQIAGILLDVAGLSAALRKPLTARLMPIPGLRAGDRTAFDFPYFATATVLDPGPAPEVLLAKLSG